MSVTIPPKFSALGEAALRIEPTNFTPRKRTPWGGTRISEQYKQLPKQLIGESWEISVEPQFPSHALCDARTLQRWLAEEPTFMLGAPTHPGCALLVKLLDTADRLSLQIHPHGDEPFLAKDESGKPESWLVLHADPGAGIFLGLADGVGENDMRNAIGRGPSEVESLLHFEPVKRGDFFRIDAGTPHAIGAGLTLVEPQRVEAGKQGLTYRYYDWARRYDADGAPNESGQPRPLHLEEALKVTNWNAPRGPALMRQVRSQTRGETDGPLRMDRLLGANANLTSSLLEVASICGNGDLELAWQPQLCGVTVVAGRCTLRNAAGESHLVRGQSAVIPAALAPETVLVGEAVHAIVCSAP